MPAFRPDGRTPIPKDVRDPDATKTAVNFSVEDLRQKRATEAATGEQPKPPEQADQKPAAAAAPEKPRKSPREIERGLSRQIDALAQQSGTEGKMSLDETIRHLDGMGKKIAEQGAVLGLSPEQVTHLQSQCEQQADNLIEKTPERTLFFGLMQAGYQHLEVLIPPPPAEQKAMLVACREGEEYEFSKLGYTEVGRTANLADTRAARKLMQEFGGTDAIQRFDTLQPVREAAQTQYQREVDTSRGAHRQEMGKARIIEGPTPEVTKQLEGIGFVVSRIQNEFAQPITADRLDDRLGYIQKEVERAVEQYAGPYRGRYNMARMQFEVTIQVRPPGVFGRFRASERKQYSIDVDPIMQPGNTVRITPKA